MSENSHRPGVISQLELLSPADRARAITLIDSIVALLPQDYRDDTRHVLVMGGGLGGAVFEQPEVATPLARLMRIYGVTPPPPRSPE